MHAQVTLFPQTGVTGNINQLIPFKRHLGLTFTSPVLPQDYIREWNSLADSLISAAECAENSVIRFMVTHPVIGGHQLSVQSEII